MEPLKSLIPLAKWLLRIAMGLMVYSIYFHTFREFDVKSVSWFLSLLALLFAVFLLVGGFMKKNSLTVVSGMILFLVSLLMIFMGDIDIQGVIRNVPPAAIGFYFMARGNRG